MVRNRPASPLLPLPAAFLFISSRGWLHLPCSLYSLKLYDAILHKNDLSAPPPGAIAPARLSYKVQRFHAGTHGSHANMLIAARAPKTLRPVRFTAPSHSMGGTKPQHQERCFGNAKKQKMRLRGRFLLQVSRPM